MGLFPRMALFLVGVYFMRKPWGRSVLLFWQPALVSALPARLYRIAQERGSFSGRVFGRLAAAPPEEASQSVGEGAAGTPQDGPAPVAIVA